MDLSQHTVSVNFRFFRPSWMNGNRQGPRNWDRSEWTGHGFAVNNLFRPDRSGGRWVNAAIKATKKNASHWNFARTGSDIYNWRKFSFVSYRKKQFGTTRATKKSALPTWFYISREMFQSLLCQQLCLLHYVRKFVFVVCGIELRIALWC